LKASQSSISEAIRVIKIGGLIVYPTDTVYGLGCDPFNRLAVKRLIDAKGERKKPLPILASDVEHVKVVAEVTEAAEKLARKFWPGPLTIVLKKKRLLPQMVTFGRYTVGVRVPNHSVALELLRRCDGLLIGTSANISGKKSTATAEEAANQLGGKVDLILDGGRTRLRKGSTVINLADRRFRLERVGPISLREIKSVLE
jgi:L-threonylcarbamoyladenylate synthase